MKKLILIVLFFLSNVLLFSQPGKIQEIFSKYAGKDGFTSVNLSDLSALFGDMGNNFKEDMKKEIGDVSGIKILTFDFKKKGNKKLGDEFANDLKKFIPDAGYKEFMSVNEDGNHVRMYTRKQGNVASEFLMIVTQKADESVLIWINGALNLSNVGKIGKMFEDLDELKHQQKGVQKKED